MIKSWKHKGLKTFYETDNTKGIQAKHSFRLKIILQRLDAAIIPQDLDLPGMQFHKLKGELKEHYSVSVSGNWRVIYKFEADHATVVNYLDYH